MCFPSEVEAETVRQPGERPSKRRCFWEYRRARESATKKKLGGDVHWSLSWSSSTLPSTLYRREGENTAALTHCHSLSKCWNDQTINRSIIEQDHLFMEILINLLGKNNKMFSCSCFLTAGLRMKAWKLQESLRQHSHWSRKCPISFLSCDTNQIGTLRHVPYIQI